MPGIRDKRDASITQTNRGIKGDTYKGGGGGLCTNRVRLLQIWNTPEWSRGQAVAWSVRHSILCMHACKSLTVLQTATASSTENLTARIIVTTGLMEEGSVIVVVALARSDASSPYRYAVCLSIFGTGQAQEWVCWVAPLFSYALV